MCGPFTANLWMLSYEVGLAHSVTFQVTLALGKRFQEGGRAHPKVLGSVLELPIRSYMYLIPWSPKSRSRREETVIQTRKLTYDLHPPRVGQESTTTVTKSSVYWGHPYLFQQPHFLLLGLKSHARAVWSQAEAVASVRPSRFRLKTKADLIQFLTEAGLKLRIECAGRCLVLWDIPEETRETEWKEERTGSIWLQKRPSVSTHYPQNVCEICFKLM